MSISRELTGLIRDLQQLIPRFGQSGMAARDYGCGRKLFPAEIQGVEIIARWPGLSAKELSLKLGVTKGAVSQLLSRLEKKGLVTKERDLGGTRRFSLRLTALGQTAFEGYLNFLSQNCQRLAGQLENLPQDQIRGARFMIRTLGGHLNGNHGRGDGVPLDREEKLGKTRIILYAGKGGVGKTSVAAASGVAAARKGLKTLVMSLDPAHSLSDVFDLDRTLMDKNQGLPFAVADNLEIQELDVHEEIGKNWGEIHSYLSILLNTTGIDDILAEELAVLPGMEELSSLLHINRYINEETYDLIILDCAPTAESLRFVSLPKTLDWYMSKIFKLERKLLKYARPVISKVTDVPVPDDNYFVAIERLYKKLRGVDKILTDPRITTARLVTQAEKMVLKETQRAFMFFSLHELTVDAIVVNRVFPAEVEGDYLKAWQARQEEYMALARTFFAPMPIFELPFYRSEVLGLDKLERMARDLFGEKDPTEVFHVRPTYSFHRENGHNSIRLHLPFVAREEIDLSKISDELIIKIGNFRKNIILPRSFARLEPTEARLEEGELVIDFGGIDV